MTLRGHDLAILTARFGVARFGASRFGFIPCPEDVRGAGTDEPGEYVWKEVTPSSQEVLTDWTLVAEDCICRQLCTLALGTISLDDPTPLENVDVTASVTLSGVIGEVDGVVHIDWGDGRHDFSEPRPLTNGTLQFTSHYHVPGTYTITIEVTDERECHVEETIPITVETMDPLAADFTGTINGAGLTGGSGADTDGIVLDSTVTGGSGVYSYAWKVWNEYSSEIAPDYTSTTADPTFAPPIGSACNGTIQLVVTDTLTMNTAEVEKPYDWNCI